MEMTTEWSPALTTLFAFVFLMGLFINLLLLYIIFRFSIMKTVSNVYTCNLVITNLLYVCTIPFYVVEESTDHWPFGEIFCKGHKYTAYTCYMVTNLIVGIICADRYLAVCHPSRLNFLETYKVSLVLSLTVWSVALAYDAPILQYAAPTANSENCSVKWPADEKKTWFVIRAIVGFVITGTLVFILLSLVIIQLKRQVNESARSLPLETQRSSLNLTLSLSLLYLICWTPYWLLGAFRNLGDGELSKRYRPYLHYTLGAGFSYLAISPVLFIVFDIRSKRCFNNIFGIKTAYVRRLTADALNIHLKEESPKPNGVQVLEEKLNERKI